MTDTLESDVRAAVSQMAPIAGMARFSLKSGTFNAAGHTRPAFYEADSREPDVVNVDNLMLGHARVAGEPAVALAIAHGNYKDSASALASAAAMVTARALLATDFLGEADVGPTLQRLFHEADARIRTVADGPLPSSRSLLETCVGTRRSLRGIGASMLAALVTSKHVFVAHAGECRALLVDATTRTAKQLTRSHTLAMTPEGRAAIAKDPSQRADLENVVLHILGFGNVQVELTRAPFPLGARLVISNPAIRSMPGFAGIVSDLEPGEAVVRIADAISSDERGRYLPATLAIVSAMTGA